MQIVQMLLIFLIFLNFWILGVSRIRSYIKILAYQGVVIGCIPILRLETEMIVLGIVIILLKAVIFPKLLFNMAKKIKATKEEKPYISLALAPLLGALFLLIASRISVELMTPIFIIIVGFFLTITRRKAINQIASFMIFENGIFILGFMMAAHFPIIIEMIILLDVLAAVSVMVLSVDKINKTFTHADVDKLDSLKG
jgi:hydrogenase-4 component E